jgi:hypothetical protein
MEDFAMQRPHLKQLAGLTLALACATATQAVAHNGVTIVTATFAGVVSGPLTDTVDRLGFFGSPGANLAGQPYTMTFVENDNKTTNTYGVDPAGNQSDSASGPLNATLTIDGFSRSFTAKGSLTVQDGPQIGNGYLADVQASVHVTPVLRITEVFYSDIVSQFYFPGLADYHSYILSGSKWTDPSLPDFSGNFQYYTNITGSPRETLTLLPDELSVSSVDPPSPAPEPASWALMIGGLFCLGAALRRRGALTAAQGRAARARRISGEAASWRRFSLIARMARTSPPPGTASSIW